MTATLNPRAVAVQGIGFSPLLVALQGLLPSDEPPQPVVIGPGGHPWHRHLVPGDLLVAQRQQLIEEDELMLLILANCAAAGLLN